eukprot:TRINITY_DN5051_c0_g1_i1.p1 TRINITY_DN5051_c0_g1~~TRINITY_DN5051_c0_g1_i1.p1  ORF type:complete len:826 (-),score=206.62 TRINITY_DN5051_c0_g1_i1:59-2512(-)
MSDSDSGGSDFELASGGDSEFEIEDKDVDIEGEDSDDEMPTKSSNRRNIVIPETPPKPAKPSLKDLRTLNMSSTYDSDDVSPAKERPGPQTGSTWSGKPTAKYTERRRTGGLLDRVFAVAPPTAAPTESPLQRTLDQFKFRPGGASGKRARPEHPDPSEVNADEWVETRPEKRQKLEDDNDEDTSLKDLRTLNMSSTYDSDDVSPAKERPGPQTGSTWSGKPTAKYTERRRTGGLLDRVFAVAPPTAAPTESPLQRTLDQFKFRPGGASGKRARPEHPDPSEVNADEWVETRPEKRQKLEDDNDEDDILSPHLTPQKDLKRLRTAGDPSAADVAEEPGPSRRLPPSLFGGPSAIPPGRTMRRRTVTSYAPPKNSRKRRSDSDEDSMNDFIVDSDEDEDQRAARHKRYRKNNAAYNPDLDEEDEEPVLDDDAIRELEELEEQEEELERKSKKMRRAKKAAAPSKRAASMDSDEGANGDSQSSGRLRRLRKTAEELTNHAEPLILDISSDEDAPASTKKNTIVLDVSVGGDDEDNVMILDEEDEEEEAGESSSEDVADEETIAALDSIIQQTEDYTSRLRSRLAEMKIDDKKNSISQTEDALYERAPSCLTHKLKDYQLIGINWMYCLNQEGLNGILADEMGLGKTIQSIALLALMYEKGDYGPHLVVVPASTLSNWERELRKWAPVLNVCQYYGSQQERAYIQDDISRQRRRATGGKWDKDNYNIVLTTYQMATRKEDSNFLKKFQFSYMILDEAQNIKNQGSMRYKNLFRQKTKHRILLTGIPLQKNLDQLWALLQILTPQLFHTIDFQPLSRQTAR